MIYQFILKHKNCVFPYNDQPGHSPQFFPILHQVAAKNCNSENAFSSFTQPGQYQGKKDFLLRNICHNTKYK